MLGKKVAVILPTYNGADHLQTQLDSILNQTYSCIEIYLRDDGSTDETLSVAQGICDANATKKNITILRDSLGNLGCPDSFFQIIRAIPPADYYAFCDQDDIWLKNKIQYAVETLEEMPPEEANVYFSSFDYYSADGSFIRHAPIQSQNTPLFKTLFYTPGLGFTIVFNRKACESFIINVNCGSTMQDRWVLRCGSCLGNVHYDPRITAQHIRHEEAVTAADRKFIDLAKNFMSEELFGSAVVNETQKISHFLTVFESKLSEENKRTLNLFCRQAGLGTRIRKLFFPHRLRPTFAGEIAIRLLFLFGKA